MTVVSKALTAFGALLLAHACYSAHEHSSQPFFAGPSSGEVYGSSSSSSAAPPVVTSSAASASASSVVASASSTPATAAIPPLPADIIIETLVAVLLLCLGIVAGSPALQPLTWRVWAGQIERQGGTEDVAGAKDVPVINPFSSLEERVGFWDIRAKRKEFDEWVREQGAAKS